MRSTRLALLLAVAALISSLFAPTVAGGEAGRPDRCDQFPALATAQGAKQRAEKGWNADKLKTSKSAQKRVRIQAKCAPSADGRKHVRHAIEDARYQYKVEVLYVKLTDPPGQDRLRVLRGCESGAYGYHSPAAPAGAYGMLQGWAVSLPYYLDSGWVELTGDEPTSQPYQASKRQQDIRASLLYRHGGSWECPF